MIEQNWNDDNLEVKLQEIRIFMQTYLFTNNESKEITISWTK